MNMHQRHLLLIGLALLWVPAAAAEPRVFILDGAQLAASKRRVAAGDQRLAAAMAQIKAEASEALKAGPYSVLDDKNIPPSGDRHDYMSVGPYWWPDPAKADGLPYVRRDGEVNPEYHRYDNVGLHHTAESVNTLALAWYLTEHEPYAAHAARLLRSWFLDPATRMNPHLEFGQGIPGQCNGRAAGIIETACLVRLVDSVALLPGSLAWGREDEEGLEKWFAAYLQWLLESRYGQEEGRARNNHGTWYDAQVVSLALSTGRDDLARQVLEAAKQERIARQIKPSGEQPQELARTKALSYSTMNLRGMFDLASMGQRVGVDLWGYQSSDGRSIRRALDWLVPFVTGDRPWQHPQIARFDPAAFVPLLRRAAIAYDEPRYEALIGRLKVSHLDADQNQLLWPAERTAEAEPSPRVGTPRRNGK